MSQHKYKFCPFLLKVIKIIVSPPNGVSKNEYTQSNSRYKEQNNLDQKKKMEQAKKHFFQHRIFFLSFFLIFGIFDFFSPVFFLTIHHFNIQFRSIVCKFQSCRKCSSFGRVSIELQFLQHGKLVST